MPTDVNRDDVQRLVAHGAQLVEVLPRKAFDKLHLPGALSLPLERLDLRTSEQLARDRPIVVYCYDMQ
jgi:rhodanese-related sulfurtransferase